MRPNGKRQARARWNGSSGSKFREWVPAKIQTVLLPLGTLEPHGAAPNGTDILAPVAMARQIAPRKCDGFAGDPLWVRWNPGCIAGQLHDAGRSVSWLCARRSRRSRRTNLKTLNMSSLLRRHERGMRATPIRASSFDRVLNCPALLACCQLHG